MKRIIHIFVITLASAALWSCASARFSKHAGPPRIEINTAGTVFVGTDRTAVEIKHIPEYLRVQDVPIETEIAMSHSGATDPVIVAEVWKQIVGAGWRKGLTIVK